MPVNSRPGAACVGCNKRKLRCSRDAAGCNNCHKTGLPCVYPALDPPKKRGPYKKTKPARNGHLEELLHYLQPPAQASTGGIGVTPEQTSGLGIGVDRSEATECLVKDALNALTSTFAINQDKQDAGEDEPSEPFTNANIRHIRSDLTNRALHPATVHVFSLWHIFVSRVDPLTKIIHCPSIGMQLTVAVTNATGKICPRVEILMFAIYFCAVTALESYEARTQFDEDQQKLLSRYGLRFEAALANDCDEPSLETLQALILYIMACRRRELGANLRALFLRAVNLARHLKVDADPKRMKYSPFEAEMRRRAWWQLCSLESRGAEEGEARLSSVAEACEVDLPSNLNDADLNPRATETPQPRNGITDMTFVLIRLRNMQLILMSRMIRKTHANSGDAIKPIAIVEQKKLYESHQSFMEEQFYKYMDDTRPYDWLCRRYSQSMSLKARMVIDHPAGRVLANSMSDFDRVKLLQSSVQVISHTQSLKADHCVKQWRWFWRGYIQWHALAIIVTELSHSGNSEFAEEAWAVLHPVLQGWSGMYRDKRDEPAWNYVNTLIERAQKRRMIQEQLSQVKVIDNRTGQTETTKLKPSPHTPLEQQSRSWDSSKSRSHPLVVHESTPTYMLPTYDTITSPPAQTLESSLRDNCRTQHGSLTDGLSTVEYDSSTQLEVTGADCGGSFPGDDSWEHILRDIDFDAFGTVFANEAWDFPGAYEGDDVVTGEFC
nr:bikaverin cluster transcription factor bik5 [Quercus suber]